MFNSRKPAALALRFGSYPFLGNVRPTSCDCNNGGGTWCVAICILPEQRQQHKTEGKHNSVQSCSTKYASIVGKRQSTNHATTIPWCGNARMLFSDEGSE